MRWYDVVVALCYFSFFFLPYVTAGAMWLRSRADFYRWSLRFVGPVVRRVHLLRAHPGRPAVGGGPVHRGDVVGPPEQPAVHGYGDHAAGGGTARPLTTHLNRREPLGRAHLDPRASPT